MELNSSGPGQQAIRNHSLRILYFYYALILYNAWLLANLEIAKKFTIKFGIITINMPLLSGIFHALFIEYLRDNGRTFVER